MARRARGGRVGDYEHEVLIRSRPRRRFGLSLPYSRRSPAQRVRAVPGGVLGYLSRTPGEAQRSGFAGKRRSKEAVAVFAARRKRRQADFATTSRHGQSNSPPAGGETPLRKQYLKGGAPRSSRPTQKTALPSPPHPALRATFPPRGRLFGGIISSSVWPSASHLSPGGRLIRRAGGKM